MTNIGAEVGQKMRSAIKAKLLELNCYVDDELPDYIMVMVANKRTKSQMKEDLQLFLSTKTAAFVDWLHIVLKKLKEVTVTNPEAYKKTTTTTTKRKFDELTDINIKKEKKKSEKKSKTTTTTDDDDNRDGSGGSTINPDSQYKSLTDDLPINANILAEQRKIVIMKENNRPKVIEDNFDIPLLSEVNMSSEKELEDIERKIKNVKSRLGLLVDSSSSESDDCLNIKAEPDDLITENNKVDDTRKIQLIKDVNLEPNKRTEHARITFNNDDDDESKINNRKSILERLGKRRTNENETTTNSTKRTKIDLKSDFRQMKDERMKSTRKESVLNRLGVMSKVSVPQKDDEPPPLEETFKGREVPSVIKIKPRIIPPDTPQANKKLLLIAVAEAQKSIAQTPTVGNNIKPDALFTKRYKEKIDEKVGGGSGRKLSEVEKNKIKKFIVSVSNNNNNSSSSSSKEKLNNFSYTRDNEQEEDNNIKYIPKIVTKTQTTPKYIPTTVNKKIIQPTSVVEDEEDEVEEEDEEIEKENDLTENQIKQKFIVTLDGIKSKQEIIELTKNDEIKSIKSRLDKRKSPSPIIFDKITTTTTTNQTNNNKSKLIPDKLPIIHAPSSIKNKERCKYWPSCRQGDKCEFVHPTINCELFPQCKFGDKCLYIHPTCKFGSSCTRRDCPYVHLNKLIKSSSSSSKLNANIIATGNYQSMQVCKFYPNCTNVNCTFYHPKPCKFGKYCKNQDECNFSHSFVPSKSSLIWRSK